MSPVYYSTKHCKNCECCSVFSVLSILSVKSRSILSGLASLREVIFLKVFPRSQHNRHVLRCLRDQATSFQGSGQQTRAQLLFQLFKVPQNHTLSETIMRYSSSYKRLICSYLSFWKILASNAYLVWLVSLKSLFQIHLTRLSIGTNDKFSTWLLFAQIDFCFQMGSFLGLVGNL